MLFRGHQVPGDSRNEGEVVTGTSGDGLAELSVEAGGCQASRGVHTGRVWCAVAA